VGLIEHCTCSNHSRWVEFNPNEKRLQKQALPFGLRFANLALHATVAGAAAATREPAPKAKTSRNILFHGHPRSRKLQFGSCGDINLNKSG
jgi:hypothetical protein